MENISIQFIIGCVVFIALFIIWRAVLIVQQQTCAVIERLGKFHKVSHAGLCFLIPFIDSVLTRLSLRINQLNVSVETKTQDNVFVNIIVAVQFKVIKDRAYDACYMLQDPESQIRAFVFDLVRAQVPNLTLDNVFSKKNDIADAVKLELEKPMGEFGYEIIKTLVTDINPDANVKAAMNEINTAQRLKVAAIEKGEAEKILKVKQAEAEAEASILHGKGIAGQRQAIIEGLGQSVEEFVKQIPGTTAAHVMDMVLLIQYIDTLKEIGGSSQSNIVFIPHTPGNVQDIAGQIRETILASDMINKAKTK